MAKRSKSAPDHDGWIPIGSSEVSALKLEFSNFVKFFGREPGKGDPVFAEWNYYYSEVDFRRETVRGMKAAGTPPHLIYVFLKTGLIPTKKNIRQRDMKSINLAISEFEKRKTAGEELEEILSHRSQGEHSFNMLKSASIVLSHAIYTSTPVWNKLPGEDLTSAISFLFTQNARAACGLLEHDFSMQCLPVLRVMLENYIDLKLARRDPTFREVLHGILGVKSGLSSFPKKANGSIDYNKVFVNDAGKVLDIPSRRSRARSLGGIDFRIFEGLYHDFSELVHSDLSSLRFFQRGEGFCFSKPDFSGTAHLYFWALICMHCNELRCVGKFGGKAKVDLVTMNARALSEFGIHATHNLNHLDSGSILLVEEILGFFLEFEREPLVKTAASTSLDIFTTIRKTPELTCE